MITQNQIRSQEDFSSYHEEKLDPPTVLFLKSLFQYCESGYINLRFLPSKKSFFYPLSEMGQIQKIVEANRSQDIYFGIGTRADGDGRKAGILQIPALLVDLDLYRLTNVEKEESQQRLRDFPLQPSYTLNSGGGQYLLWLLKEPSRQEDIPKVENFNWRLASYLHGDVACKDVSRIIRVLHSINHKYPHKPIVTIESFHPEREFNLDDFEILPEERPIDRVVKISIIPYYPLMAPMLN